MDARPLPELEIKAEASETFKQHSHLLVIGSPGSGKSTLLAYLASGIADGRFSTEVGWRDRPLPFVLVVRTLKDVNFTPKWFAESLGFDLLAAHKAIEQDRVILLVDGLDEATPQIRRELLAGLDSFVKDHPGIRA